jgi:hypothetical protein
MKNSKGIKGMYSGRFLSGEGRPVKIRRKKISAEDIRRFRRELEEATDKSFKEFGESRRRVAVLSKYVILD